MYPGHLNETLKDCSQYFVKPSSSVHLSYCLSILKCLK